MASTVVTPPPAPDLHASVEAVRHGGDRRQRRDPRSRKDGVPEPDPEEIDASPPPAGRLDVVA